MPFLINLRSHDFKKGNFGFFGKHFKKWKKRHTFFPTETITLSAKKTAPTNISKKKTQKGDKFQIKK